MSNISFEGNILSVSTKSLFSTKTISVSLDSLRLTYLFLPDSFKWLVLQTKVQYRFVNLDTLTEEEFSEISKQIQRQDSYNLAKTFVILKDYADHQVSLSLKDLADDHVDLFPILAQNRAASREKQNTWLQDNPLVKFGLNKVIGAAGIGTADKKYWMPWDSFEKFTVYSNGSATIFNFMATKASKIKQFGASGIPVEQTKCWLAELDFWQNLGQSNKEKAAQ